MTRAPEGDPGIVFIPGDGDADLDDPMVVGDVGGDLGLGRPARPIGLVDTAIEIDEGAGGFTAIW